jgi:hypothetical protein
MRVLLARRKTTTFTLFMLRFMLFDEYLAALISLFFLDYNMMEVSLFLVALAASQGLCESCISSNAVNPSCKSPELAYHRDVFFIGGRDIVCDLGNVTADQLYVEKLTPTTAVSKQPIVFFHGGGTSGVTFLKTTVEDGLPTSLIRP